MVTLAEQLRLSADRLTKAGIDTAQLDARVLTSHALKLPIESIVRNANEPLKESEVAQVETLIARRENHEPVSHLIGERGFWKDTFKVTKHVLTPRPDSETMIEGLTNYRPEKNAAYTILDLGTGSGCLLLSALREYANANGIGVDISDDALSVARENADALKLSARARFVKSNWFDALDKNTRADIVLMNPPYIPTDDITHLASDVKDHEPHLALDGGQDGFSCYRKIFSQLSLYLSNHALILIEVGVNQADEIAALGHTNGMKLKSILPDLAGTPRIVVLELPE